MTPTDIIARSLRTASINGIGQYPGPEDLNDGFVTLNNMIAGWNARRWFVYHEVETVFQSTGAQNYTIGIGGDFATLGRVAKICSAYARLTSPSGPVDYPLAILGSAEDYSLIALKSLTSFPQTVWLDSGYPLGTLHFWPIPNASYELHVWTAQQLAPFPSLTTTVNLPLEYFEAIDYNLALRLLVNYGQDAGPGIVALAKASASTIFAQNAQIPQMLMPVGLLPRRGISWAGFIGGYS